MIFFSTANPWASVFGILGNIVSVGVFLSPMPTFIRVVKKKSTEGFHSFPYIVALFSSMLWIYYALAKRNETFLITINSFGCVIEAIYISLFVTYAPKKPKATAVKLVAFINLGVFGAIVVLTQLLTKGHTRIRVIGGICIALAASVFGAPLSIIKQVIRTKSVEFMPFWLSFSLSLNGICWLLYGIFRRDLNIAAPNVLGLVFSMAQMILYAVYRKNKVDGKLPETVNHAPPTAAAQPQTVVQVGSEKAIPDRAVQMV